MRPCSEGAKNGLLDLSLLQTDKYEEVLRQSISQAVGRRGSEGDPRRRPPPNGMPSPRRSASTSRRPSIRLGRQVGRLINLIHEIDFLRFAIGEIVSIGAMASNRRRGFAVEDAAAALIEFENGALGSFFASDSAVSPWTTEQGVGESVDFPFSGESSYRFMGSRGALEFPNLVHWSQTNGVQDWNQPIQAQRLHATTIDPYSAQLDHFRDVIRGLTPSLQTVEDGARTLIATLAVTEAAVTGRRVDLGDRYDALLGTQARHQRKAS